MKKRLFDLLVSLFLLLLLGWVILLAWIIAALDTKSSGWFVQERIGQYGKPFRIYKLRTLRESATGLYASKAGILLRKYKLDELPQLVNVLVGDMSMVGPRPDVKGYYDALQGEARTVLCLKPGITSWASLKYFDEEQLLAQQQQPEHYNDTVLFPDKVKMNLDYYYTQNLTQDLKILLKTIHKYLYF